METEMKTVRKIKMQFDELPFYLTVNQVITDDVVSVEIESSIHVNRLVTLPTIYSLDYVRSRPNTFRGEVLFSVVRQYNLKPEPLRYS